MLGEYSDYTNMRRRSEMNTEYIAPLLDRHSAYDTLCYLGRTIVSLCSSLMVSRYCPEIITEFEEFFENNR